MSLLTIVKFRFVIDIFVTELLVSQLFKLPKQQIKH
jgi:hypothetical protein